MSKIAPHLWFADKAEEAAAFYATLFPGSHIDSVTELPADSLNRPPRSVKMVEFTLVGQEFLAISAGPLEPFNHAISFVVSCDNQAEIDRLWAELGDGGTTEQCGWLRDRYGVSWQIVPASLAAMLRDPDRERAKRVAEVMIKMVKLDMDDLETAYGKQA